MKILLVFSILFLIACNDSSETATTTTTDTSTTTTDTTIVPVEQDGTAVKTPAVDTTSDMLNPSVVNNKAWERKKHAGVSWLGIGTEPFWSIERKNDTLVFQLAEWSDNKKALNLKARRLVNSKDSVVYYSEGVSGEHKIRVTLIPTECSDGMSDRKYDYSVKVIYNSEIYKGCAVIF